MFRFLKDLVWNTGKKYYADNCPQLAAAITYYVIFSLFPLLIFVVGVASLFLNTNLQHDIVNEVLKDIPLNQGDGRNTVEDAVKAISGPNATAIGLVGLLGMLWAGSSMFTAIRRALNIVYRDITYQRPWFQQKVMDLTLVLGLGLFFIASIASSAALRVIQTRSDDLAWIGRLSKDMGLAWTFAEYAIPFLLSLGAFLVTYTVMPSRNRNVANALPGALVAAVLFEVVKFGFSFYVTNFRDFDLVFGSLGAVATFMFWVYINSQIMLLGAEVAAVYPKVRDQTSRQQPFEGMGVPFYMKLFRTVRSLFVRKEKATLE
ncbi:MAG TPA: YihY/virulence factor BrkB family protein [Dehalococcoidia bacterium]|jgi:membrane protein